jgi:salicylate hydroxylase
MAATSPRRVLIIGCGIAGPVLALLLQRNGYEPIVFEKVGRLGVAGASLMINPNGYKVLELLGINKHLDRLSVPIRQYRQCTIGGEMLAESDAPTRFLERYGGAAIGVKRTELNLLLRRMLLDAEIELCEGWDLQHIDENTETVTAYFNDSRKCSGSILVGCDGIKSVCRTVMLRAKDVSEAAPAYTGLCQVGYISSCVERCG